MLQRTVQKDAPGLRKVGECGWVAILIAQPKYVHRAQGGYFYFQL